MVQLSGESASPVMLKRMIKSLAHRGPDGDGIFTDGSVGLAHCRLSIIDLSSAGHQPMATEDRRYTIIYNGEIYNFQELRIELEALGHRFHSRTDSEVVLKSLAEWGIGALERFNGMFAFALWDRLTRELTLARDRYGIKPLYFAITPKALLFASEVKAILAHPAYSVALNREGLMEYLTFQNFFTDQTLFSGISLLPAGTWLRMRPNGAVTAPQRYWDFSFQEPENPCADAEYVEELKRLFQQAVRRQLVSDVDVGAYLSGGLDSGSITAVAARELPFIKSFTCGFDLNSASGLEISFDEREAAEFMSYVFRTEHYEMVLKAGDMERVMPRLTWHLEEPRVGQSYPNFYAAQLASKFVKVVLSGAGGDEMFAGYPWRYYKAVVNANFDEYIEKYYAFWQRLFPEEMGPRIFGPMLADHAQIAPRDIFRDVFRQGRRSLTRPEDYINHSLYFEAKTFLHGLLVVEDKLSMAHSLETRLPFLDNDLVDFAMTVPAAVKLANLTDVIRLNENEPGPKSERYYRRTKDGKIVLRKAMEHLLPASIMGREKQGFSAPDASWFKGDSIEYVRRTLCGAGARIYEFLDYAWIQRLINEHLEGKENRRLLIWSLLSLENWCCTFLN